MDATEQRIALLQRAASGRRIRDIGIGLCLSVPILAFGLGLLTAYFDSDVLATIAAGSIIAAGIPGALLIGTGIHRRRRAYAELAAAEARQLPPARLL